jgi:MATE family multidrug resistance protein
MAAARGPLQPLKASASVTVPEGRLPRFSREARALLLLAGPIIGSQVVQLLAGLIDILMSGRAGAAEQAVVGLGVAIWIPVGVALMSVVQAISPIVARHFGADDKPAIVHDTHQALWLALVLGVLPTLALPWARDLMHLTQVPPELVGKTMLFLLGISLGLPAMMMFRTLSFYSSSLNHPAPTLVLGLIGLVSNGVFNYALIGGHWGLPGLGGAGCGWATGIGMWISLVLMSLYTARSSRYEGVRLLRSFAWPRWADQQRLLRLGLPMGAAVLAEVAAFTGVALLVAPLGARAIAAHQCGLNLASMAFMLPMGLSAAISIRVGQALGAGDAAGARFSARSGLALALLLALGVSPLMAVLRGPIAQMYSPDAQVQALTVKLVLFAAAWHWADGLQVCAIGALRGYHVTFSPMILVLLAYWVLAIPLGYGLAHRGVLPWGLEPAGLYGYWIGLLSGLVFAALALSLMLHRVIGRSHVAVRAAG